MKRLVVSIVVEPDFAVCWAMHASNYDVNTYLFSVLLGRRRGITAAHLDVNFLKFKL